MFPRPWTHLAMRLLLAFMLIMGVFSTRVQLPALAAPLDTSASRADEDSFLPNLVQAASFPSTDILDDFNRPNGPLGSNWGGVTGGYTVVGSQVDISSGGNIYWAGTSYGIDQEAFVTFTNIDPSTDSSGEINLVLKAQSNTSISPGQISVLYSPSGQFIQVWTYNATSGWQQLGQTLPAVFGNGDQFGAIARANGQVEAYRNGVLLGTWSITSWIYYAQGGYIGMANFSSGSTTLDNFGGGTLASSPTATPTMPAMPTPGGTPFPSTSLLDDFTRPDGPLGANWGGSVSGYTIDSNQLSAGSGGNIYWQPGFFGVDQEAFVTLTHLDPTAGEINLVLKAQSNTSINPGQISVMYSPSSQHIQVWAFSNPGVGWQQIGQTLPAIFVDGDQFGVRAKANGQLDVYKNGIFLSNWNVTNWPYYPQGGFIGLSHFGGNGSTILDDFGGGTVTGSPAPTFTPTAIVCTDPTTCNPVEAKPAVWRCNTSECTTGEWHGGAINWPSWSAYQNNARTGDNSRSVFSLENGEPLYPYMGSWADGCQITSVSGAVLVVEWQRGTDVWRATHLEPGQTHTIDLVAPEDNVLIEAADGTTHFSASLTNCTPQDIHGATATPSVTSTATPSHTPTTMDTPTSTPTATFTPSATPTRTFTPTNTATFTPSATNTRTFTPTSTATPTQRVTSFTLVSADTNLDIRTLINGETINLATLPTRNLNIRANTSPATVGSVRFDYDGVVSYRVENTAPYALASNDLSGNYMPWTPTLGQHTVSATTFSGSNATGSAGGNLTISFTVVDVPPSATPTNTPTRTPTATATPTSSNRPLYLSLADSQTVGGVSAADEDILRFNGQTWSMFFDGSDVGTTNVDLAAFSFIDSNSLLMTFNAAVTLNSISVSPQDVVRFDATSLGNTTAGTFSMYLDGSDVGLTTTNESIDSVDVLSGPLVAISTVGDVSVSGVTGGDEDILAFDATSLGSSTRGTWSMGFDGSDVGLGNTANENVDALDVTSNWTVYLSTTGNFAVPGVSGADEDVFVCTLTSIGTVTGCTYSSALYFDGSTWGLSANDVDGFSVLPPTSP